MEKKIESLEKHVNFLYDELEDKEKELEEMKATIRELKIKKESKCQNQCSRMEEVLKYAEKNKKDVISVKEIADSQKVKISCLRGHRNELLDKIDDLNDNHVAEIKQKDELIARIDQKHAVLKGQLSDTVDELDKKNKEIEEFVNENKKEDLKTSSTSLQDEIDIAISENNKLKLENEVESLKHKLNLLGERRKERVVLIEKIEEISKNKDLQVEH